MTHPCPFRSPCQPCDPPLANLSAEEPDVFQYIGIGYNPFVPPNGGNYSAKGCKFWCYSTESQFAADFCALEQAIHCPDDPLNGGAGGGGDGPGPGGGGGGPNAVIFASAPFTCEATCPNGDTFSHSIPRGLVSSPISQEDADTRARSLCFQLADKRKVCFGFAMRPACVDVFYEHTFQVTGGVPPYNIQIDAATLPIGFTLDNATGYFSGTPTSAEAVNLLLSVTDSNSPPTVVHKTFPFFMVEIDNASLATGTVGVAYSETLTATAAPTGISWIVSAGSLPAGLTLNATTGVISGTPTTSGSPGFIISLIQGVNLICSKNFSITVIGTGPVPCGFFEPCSISKGVKPVDATPDSIAIWNGLDEGFYQVVYIDGMYEKPNILCAPDPPEQRFGVYDHPSPGGTPPIAYYLNTPAAIYLPVQDPHTEVFCSLFPTPSLAFHIEADAITDYHTKTMPGAAATNPTNVFAIWNYNIVPPLPFVAGSMSFELFKTQQLINSQPLTVSAASAIASLASSRIVLSYGGDSTGPLAFSAAAGAVQTALNALASIAADGGVVCAGTLAAGMTITWNNNGNRAEITSAITTVSPAYFAEVVTTQAGTGILPEIQTLTVAPWCPYLITFPAQPSWNGAIPNRDLWDVSTFQNWYIALIGSYSFNPPPFQAEDVSVLDVTCRNVCGPDAPLTAPSVAAGPAGNVEAGTHSWVVVFVTTVVPPISNAESGPSPAAVLNLAVNSQVNLTNVPLGPAGTTARYIFRTMLGQTIPRFVGQIPDNLTTIFTDNVADATIAIANPVQPASHFWEVLFNAVADPFSFGPPYGFYDALWRGYKATGNTPAGRYLPWAPRVQFNATQYHTDVSDGIPYLDLV